MILKILKTLKQILSQNKLNDDANHLIRKINGDNFI